MTFRRFLALALLLLVSLPLRAEEYEDPWDSRPPGNQIIIGIMLGSGDSRTAQWQGGRWQRLARAGQLSVARLDGTTSGAPVALGALGPDVRAFGLRADGSGCAADEAALRCWRPFNAPADADPAGLPPALVPVPPPPGGWGRIGAVALGTGFGCVLADDAVRCWRGADGTPPDPAPVAGLGPVAELVAGPEHACAQVEKTVLCWRPGGTVHRILTPKGGLGAVELAMSDRRVCALLGNGASICELIDEAGAGEMPLDDDKGQYPGIGIRRGTRMHCVLTVSAPTICRTENPDGKGGRGFQATAIENAPDAAFSTGDMLYDVVLGESFACLQRIGTPAKLQCAQLDLLEGSWQAVPAGDIALADKPLGAVIAGGRLWLKQTAPPDPALAAERDRRDAAAFPLPAPVPGHGRVVFAPATGMRQEGFQMLGHGGFTAQEPSGFGPSGPLSPDGFEVTAFAGFRNRFCYAGADQVQCGQTGGFFNYPSGPSRDEDLGQPVLQPPVDLARVSALGVGATHACGIVDGTVHCWGLNCHGQLGTEPTRQDQTIPAAVPGIADAVALVAGTNYSCTLDRRGAVHCWGRFDASSPGPGLTNRNENGIAWCGERGNDRKATLATIEKPTRVERMPPLVAIRAGERRACGWTASGAVWCFPQAADRPDNLGREQIERLRWVSIDRTRDDEPCCLKVPRGETLGGVPAPGAAPADLLVGSGAYCRLEVDGKVLCEGRKMTEEFPFLGDTRDPFDASRTTPRIRAEGLAGAHRMFSAGWGRLCLVDAGGISCRAGGREGETPLSRWLDEGGIRDAALWKGAVLYIQATEDTP